MTISLPWRQQRHGNGPLVHSSLTAGEMRALTELASMTPDQSVLEIGSAYGFSSIGMALAGAKVTSVDHHLHMPSQHEMAKHIRSYGVDSRIRMIVSDSRSTLPSLPSASFDGAFIDGDHSFEGCTFDVKECLRLVKPGGWIAVHDYREESCPEVAKSLDAMFTPVTTGRILIDTLYIVKVPYPRSNPCTLSVITLHLPYRHRELAMLREEVACQSRGFDVEHLIEEGPERYGVKMRRSLERSNGQYVCWLDDDDWPSPDYISSIIEGIRSNPTPDVVTFGSYTPGCEPAWLRFGHHDDSGHLNNDPVQGRIKSANHYCVWRRDVALSAPWLPRNYGAELAWYTALRHQWGGKVVEHHIPKLLHEYRYNADDTKCQDRPSIGDSLKDGGNRVVILRHVDGHLLMSTGWDKYPSTYKAYYPNGFLLSTPAGQVKLIDEIIYR